MERCSTCGEPLEKGELCGVCLLACGIAPAAELPDRIGRYRILRLLGEGGMGAVFEAEQEQPRRTVALKVIRTGLLTAEVLYRFERESQALARLHHPGIAQVYEAGTADHGWGLQPYFAMEFIEGRPIDQYADSHQLDTRQRLQLMIRICEAVQHAHERGIIHRDLKPANILVDESGQPKILDFGIARVTDADAQATRHTDIGQLIGTVAYMSPEQVLGDPLEIDTRSDVYTLGLLLYQLLAGRLPYTVTRQLHQAVQIIREHDPSPLSSVSRVYRGDIETIVGKALEKDKSRRYASAAELASDIRRYLEHQPIAARPPSATYQIRKFARRNRAVVAGVAAVFLALVGGIVASAREAARARLAEHSALAAKQTADRERDRAVTAEIQAEAARLKAAASEAQARNDRDQALREKHRADLQSATAKAVNDFLQRDVLAQASNSAQAGPGTPPDPNLRIRTALDRAAGRLDGKFDAQPLVEASIRETIGRAYQDLGLYAESQRQVERALELLRRHLGDDDIRTIGAKLQLGTLFQIQMQYQRAEPVFAGLLPAQRRKLGNRHAETLSTITKLGRSYWGQSKFELAEPLFAEALKGQSETLGEEHPDTVQTMQALGMLYTRTNRYAQSEQMLAKVIEISRRVHGEEHPITVATLNNLGELYLKSGRLPQAERTYLSVHAIQKRVRGEEHPNSLNTMSSLANVYLQTRKDVEARLLLTKLVESAPRVLGSRHVISQWSLSQLANLERKEKRYADAEQLWSRVLAAQRFPKRMDTVALATLGYVRIELKKYADAESVLREALAADEKLKLTAWDLFRDQVLLGASLAGQAKYAAAEPLLLAGFEGLARQKNDIPADDRFYVEATGPWIVQLYQDWGKPDQAMEWTRRLQQTRVADSSK